MTAPLNICDGTSQIGRDLIILRNALDRVRESYRNRGELALLDHLCAFFQSDDSPADYSMLTKSLGTTKADAKRLVNQFHECFKEFIYDEWHRMLMADEKLKKELRDLRRLFTNSGPPGCPAGMFKIGLRN
jgi:hypothetical protein